MRISSQNIGCYFAIHLLRHPHPFFQIGISPIKLHMVEFLQMLAVDSLIAENASDFENLFISPDQKPFERKLQRDAHIKILIQRVVVRHERLGVGSAGSVFQNRCLHFQKSFLNQETPDGLPEDVFLSEKLARLRIRHQIQISFTKKLLLILDTEMFGRHRTDVFGEDFPIRHLDGFFFGFGEEQLAAHLHEIPEFDGLDEKFEQLLLHISLVEEKLDLSSFVLDAGKSRSTHRAHGSHPSDQGNFLSGKFVEFFQSLGVRMAPFVFFRIRFHAEFPDLFQFFQFHLPDILPDHDYVRIFNFEF